MRAVPTSLICIFLGLAAVEASAQSPCQRQKKNAAGAVDGDFLGKSVAIDGTTAVAGMYATNDPATDGAAYVYEKSNGTWSQVAKLEQGDPGNGSDEFGNSVGVSGDVIVVGCEFNDNELGNNAGAAYVFEDPGTGWAQVAKLTASDGAGEMHFGENVAVSGTTIVVGHRENGTLGNNAGAAYVFEKQNGVWNETAKLLASDGGKNALFGDTVAIDGGTIVVGAFRADAGGMNGVGAAYVYQKVNGVWTELQKLQAGDLAGGEFGRSVAIEGGTIVAGAWKDSSQVSEGGSAYVFQDVGGAWIETQKLLPSIFGAGDWFGHSVGVSGSSILVSAHKNDLAGLEAGGAFLFGLANGTWSETAFLQSNDIQPLDQFGQWVAIDGTDMILGAPFESTNRGAAYFFETGCTSGTITRYGEGVGGANIGDLDSDDVPDPGSVVTFDVTGMPSGTNGFLWFSGSQVSLPFRGGTMLSDLTQAFLVRNISLSGGSAQASVTIPASAAGFQAFVQAGVLDATQSGGVALTNGLIVQVGS